MIVDRGGSSIREELVPGVRNMGDLLWLSFGHARHGNSAKIQVGAYYRLEARRIRISPFYAVSSPVVCSDFRLEPPMAK